MRGPLLACLAVVVSLAAPVALPTPAEALTINLQIGNTLNRGRAITCREGERMLRNRGFRDIRRIDCRGRFFVYRARRGAIRFEIAVSARDGRVVDLRRIGR